MNSVINLVERRKEKMSKESLAKIERLLYDYGLSKLSPDLAKLYLSVSAELGRDREIGKLH